MLKGFSRSFTLLGSTVVALPQAGNRAGTRTGTRTVHILPNESYGPLSNTYQVPLVLALVTVYRLSNLRHATMRAEQNIVVIGPISLSYQITRFSAKDGLILLLPNTSASALKRQVPNT